MKYDASYALFSGGHDSLCSTVIAAKDPTFAGVVHLNTGIGIPATTEFVRSTCEERGWPLIELRTERVYEELVLGRGGFPSGTASHNSMLFYLKQQPLNRWVATLSGSVGLFTGIRKAESIRRMGAGISVPERRQGRKVWLSPILEWDKIDCNNSIKTEGLERNPVVDLIHRSGECLCGALARPGEIHEIALWYPEVAARINRLEQECEARGIAACVWAGRAGRHVHPAQEALFSKAAMAPLCASCEAAA